MQSPGRLRAALTATRASSSTRPPSLSAPVNSPSEADDQFYPSMSLSARSASPVKVAGSMSNPFSDRPPVLEDEAEEPYSPPPASPRSPSPTPSADDLLPDFIELPTSSAARRELSQADLARDLDKEYAPDAVVTYRCASRRLGRLAYKRHRLTACCRRSPDISFRLKVWGHLTPSVLLPTATSMRPTLVCYWLLKLSS